MTLHFWLRMTYACQACRHELKFLLEDGCEGPRDGKPLSGLTPRFPGGPTSWPRTASGRLVIPVPFFAGPCPACEAPNARLAHVRWNEDEPVNLDFTSPPAVPHFRYVDPGPRLDTQACGEPVYG